MCEGCANIPEKDWDDLARRQFVRWRITSIARFDDSTGSRPIVFSWLASNTGMAYHSTPLAEVAM